MEYTPALSHSLTHSLYLSPPLSLELMSFSHRRHRRLRRPGAPILCSVSAA